MNPTSSPNPSQIIYLLTYPTLSNSHSSSPKLFFYLPLPITLSYLHSTHQNPKHPPSTFTLLFFLSPKASIPSLEIELIEEKKYN
jgi:hypothetical protein